MKNLLEFVEANKANTRFVFHITPDFSAKGSLVSALQEIVNVEEVYLDKPGVEKGYSYVIEELTNQGVKLDEDAKNVSGKRRCLTWYHEDLYRL